MEPTLCDLRKHFNRQGWHWPDDEAKLVLSILNALQQSLNTAHGVVPLIANQNFVVVHDLNLPFTPKMAIGTILQPPGGDQLYACIITNTLTADGFVATFNGTVPASGYSLSYILY